MLSPPARFGNHHFSRKALFVRFYWPSRRLAF